MQFREIKQHHLPAVLSIIVLFIFDSLAFYISYYITNLANIENVGIKYPWRVYFVVIFLIYITKRYNPGPRISRGQDAKLIIKFLYFVGIIYIFSKILSKTISIDKAQYDLVFLHLFLFFDILFRIIIRSAQRFFLKRGFGGRSTVIVGANEEAYHLANELIRNPSHGFKLKGYFNNSENINMNRYCSYLGNEKDIYNFVIRENIHEMIIVLDIHEHDFLLEIIGKFNLLDICIKIIPDMYEAITGQVSVNTIRGLPLLDINPDIMTEFQTILKRIMDIILTLIGVIILLPFNIIIGLIIYYTSNGGIFYKQIRVGLHGVRFKVYKFRTMYANSELLTGPVWADKNDARITNVGKLLRKYHLDEIPQLFNVLRGEMSIVGPRPERPQIIDKLVKDIPYYYNRLKVKPGITGWAQTRWVYDASVSDVNNKLKHDFYYIENLSILLDLKIILLTIQVVFRGRGR